MDLGNISQRVKLILTTPKSEWPAVAAEPDTVGGVFAGYVAIVAALPAIAAFIKDSLIGYSGYGTVTRLSIGEGIASLVLRYVITLIMVYIMAHIISALAPTFGGQKNTAQGLKTAGYALTASWVAGIAVIVPWIGWLVMLLGGIYTIYLLYIGLPHTMKCSADKAAGYTVANVLIAFVLSWIVYLIVSSVLGVGVLGGAAAKGARIGSIDSGASVHCIALVMPAAAKNNVAANPARASVPEDPGASTG